MKEAKKNDLNFIKPDLKYTTDNAAMVASAGYFKARKKEYIAWQSLKVECNSSIDKK